MRMKARVLVCFLSTALSLQSLIQSQEDVSCNVLRILFLSSRRSSTSVDRLAAMVLLLITKPIFA